MVKAKAKEVPAKVTKATKAIKKPAKAVKKVTVEKMNKAEVIQAVAKEVGETQGTVEKVLNSVLDLINKVEKVSLFKFGTFVHKTREAHTGRNPKLNIEIQVPEKTTLRFKSSKNNE